MFRVIRGKYAKIVFETHAVFVYCVNARRAACGEGGGRGFVLFAFASAAPDPFLVEPQHLPVSTASGFDKDPKWWCAGATDPNPRVKLCQDAAQEYISNTPASEGWGQFREIEEFVTDALPGYLIEFLQSDDKAQGVSTLSMAETTRSLRGETLLKESHRALTTSVVGGKRRGS